jgi:DNA invertase Pin-like site-specific DNA recombinase
MASIGYIRQSKRADLDVALSYDAQLAAIRRMAGDDIEVLSDMGRSGKAGAEHLRPGYQQLIAGMTSGRYDNVYAIALSRFSRSVPELHDLMERAKAHGVRLTTAKEGTMDPHTATGRMIFNTWANFAEFVRDMAVEAAQENVAIKRARGDRMGRTPYGQRPGDQPAAIIAAWHATRSLSAAARNLNRAGIPSWSGKPWTATAVRLVLVRIAPGTVPALNPQRGVKPSSPFLLYRLLRCPCGAIMTASRDGRGNREPVYRCHKADNTPDHGPYRVGESAALPWVMAEAARLRVPLRDIGRNAANEAERERLSVKRSRVIDSYTDGAIDKAERDRRLAAVDADVAAIVDEQRMEAIPQAVDWSQPPAIVNELLRAMWTHVELGPDLRPIRAAWRRADWRAE